MKQSRKSNRVTWASGLNLCQVREFLAEDSPSNVGLRTQYHLQNDLPPGFEAGQYLKDLSSHIPRIVWKCPPKVFIDSNWHVAAGEESQEAEIQKFTEMRMPEAVFPHRTAIPPSPSVSLNVKEEFFDDSLTPVIPQTPEEEAAAVMLSESSPSVPQDSIPSGTCKTPMPQLPASNKPRLGASPDVGADIVLAASVAADALKKSMDGSSIDTGLLIKILSDPKMVEDLMKASLAPEFTTSIPTTNIPRSMPPQCPIPPAPAPALALVDRSCGFQNLMVPKPESIRTSPQPQPLLAHENMHHAKNDVQPTISRTPQLETFHSVSLPVVDSLNKLAHKPDQVQLASKMAHKPVQVQLASDMAHKPERVQSVSNSGAFPILPPSSGSGMTTVQPELDSALTNNMATVNQKTVIDMNYIKNLIKQHGTEKKELVNPNGKYNGHYPNQIQNLENGQNVESQVVRSKFEKPCVYFGGPKGCRNGSNCPYQHDLSIMFHNRGPFHLPVAKRMRFGAEITTGKAF